MEGVLWPQGRKEERRGAPPPAPPAHHQPCGDEAAVISVIIYTGVFALAAVRHDHSFFFPLKQRGAGVHVGANAWRRRRPSQAGNARR